MAIKAITIPFSGGQDSTIDRRLAGLGKFRAITNGRLDADGRMVSRPNYTQLGTTTYDTGTFVAYDLFELDGRLCALGDRFALGYPTDVYEFVDSGAAAWRPSSRGSSADNHRLPRATGMRELARPPDQKGGVSSYDVAALGGYVLLVFNDDAAAPSGSSMLLKANSGQQILFEEFLGAGTTLRGLLQAVALTSRLWALGVSTNTQSLSARRIDPATETGWTPVSNLTTDVNGYTALAAARVVGAEQFVTVTRSGAGSMLVRRFDSAGTVIVPSGGQYAAVAGVTASFLAIEADSAANQIVVAVSNAGVLQVHSWNLATGAVLATPPDTPTEVATETCTNVALVRTGADQTQVLATVTSLGTPDVTKVLKWRVTPSTGVFTSAIPVTGSALCSGAVSVNDTQEKVVFGVVTDDPATTPNMLLELARDSDEVVPIAVKDLGFASPPSGGQLPRIAIDTSQDPDRYYWAHAVQGADGASIPVVCELRLNDPGRRQIARIGRGAVISGAMPCWYDGAQLVELGFPVRPRIVSLTSSNGAGELASGATYHYVAVQSWFDALGRLHRSPVSAPVELVLTDTTHDTVAAVITGQHSYRSNHGSAPQGSVVRTDLYRTRAIVTKTQAVIIGRISVSPPPVVLNTLTLQIYVSDLTGEQLFIVTFDAGSVDASAIAADINAVTTGRVTASNSGGAIALTLDDAGAPNQIWVTGGTAIEELGFIDNDTAIGVTEVEEGDTFHLTATAYTTVGDDSGARIAITDVRDDAADSDGIASQAVLYTLLESPLEDCSSLPADRIWAGIERLEVAGHPQRETWTSSKLSEQGFAPAFAAQGVPGFGGELVEGIEAVVTQGLSKLYLTRKSLWQVSGEGPRLNGEGRFSGARRIASDGGLVEDGWRSLLETAQGTWMQLGGDKLYLMPEGGAPQWAGFPIRELLRTFPVVAAATLTGNDQLAAFAIHNSTKTSGRIVLHDLRRGTWMVDDVGAVPIALADYQGRLCYATTTGAVFMANASAGSGAFVPLTVDTSLATIGGAAGQIGVTHVFLVGELTGEATVQLLVDYDDGAGFVSAGAAIAMTAGNGYTVGRTIREEWDLALEDCQQFALRVVTSGSSGSAGLALVAIEVHAERDAGPALLGDSNRR